MSRAALTGAALLAAVAGGTVLAQEGCVGVRAAGGEAMVVAACWDGSAGVLWPAVGVLLWCVAAAATVAAVWPRRRPVLVASGLPFRGAAGAVADPPRRFRPPPTDMTGFTFAQQATAEEGIAAVLRLVAAAEGADSAGWAEARSLLMRAVPRHVTDAEADRVLRTAVYDEATVAALPEDAKWLLIRSAVRIAAADHEFTDDERDRIVRVISDLWWYPEPAARQVLDELVAETDAQA